MAENLDPEVVFQFQEAMKEATDAAKAMPQAMNAMIDAINKAANPIKNNTKEINDNTDAIEDSTDAAEQRTKKDEAAAKAASELERVTILQKAALQDSRNALKSFAEALLSGERGFGKFGTAMSTAGDAALSFGKSLGPLGVILGGIVKGATMAASAMAQQADNTLKATDQLSKMGSAGAFSAEEVRKLGTGLGLASDQLDKFIKPVSSLGSSLISLGGNAADGVKEFQKLAQELQTSRQEYQRLGISQEELIQNTADYVNLQTMQGRQITEQMKRDGSLRVAAREYTDNLLELAALTGKDIEAVKKKNELAMAEIETAIQNNLLDQEINRLRKLDTAESNARANQLEAERKARDKLLQRVENEVGDPALRKGLAKFLATGAITEEVAALKRIGVPIEDFAAKIKQGVDVQDQFMDSLSKNGDAMMRNVGTAAMFDENTRKAFGISTEYMNYLAKARDRDEKAQSDLIKDRIQATKEGRGPAGEDPAQKARNALTEAEIKAKVALDDLVASANPLLNNFNDMSVAVKALMATVALATVALGGLAAVAGAKSIGGKIGGVLDKAKAASPIADKLLDRGSGAAKIATRAGAVGAIGYGAVSGIQAYRAGDKEGVGGAVGGTTGALVGGALGSLLGPVGTVLGGMAGQYFGEKIGRWISKDEDKKDPKVASAINSADLEQEKAANAREKYALEQQLQDSELSDAEKKLYQRRLLQTQREEALLLNQEAKLEFENAKDELEKEAARQKSDRARRTIAQADMAMAVQKLEDAKTDQEREVAQAELIAARKKLRDVELDRARQILRDSANEEERKTAQLRIDKAKQEFEEEQAIIKNDEERRKAQEELDKAVDDQKKKAAQDKIKALKEGLEKELEQIKKKYNTVEAKPANQETPASTANTAIAPVGGLGNLDVTIVESVGGRAKGGPIPEGKVALVGEEGPEFISGPAQVTNQKQMNDIIRNLGTNAMFDPSILGFDPSILGNINQTSSDNKQFDETTEDFINAFFESDKVVTSFNKELNSFVKDDPTGKMTKQLNLVTEALEDLNELINPNVPSGLELPKTGETQVRVPSASSIASSVMSQLKGILGGGSMPTAGSDSGSAPTAVPAGSGDMSAPKSKPKGILGAIASALGFSDSDTAASSDTGGKDTGDAMPTPSGNIDMLDTKKSAASNVPVGSMSEEDIKKMIIRHEGVRYRPYQDSLGLWTVGIGHLIGDGRTLPPSWNREFSKEEVLALFEKDYEHHRKAAERIPGFDKMNTVGQGALTDLTFNMGPYWINKWPNTKRKLEQGNIEGAAENLEKSKWYTQVGNRAPTIVNMVRQGQELKAALGGIFDGPSTGYPVEMHGREMVTRLDPNSLLEKLAKTPASQIASEMSQPSKVDIIDRSQDGMKELAAINMQMMEMLSDKLDGMINRLDTSNETQDRLLKFSQV